MPCIGDCNGNGRVTIDELVRAARLALDNGSGEICEGADRNRDGAITIDELVSAVGTALNGCALA